jgi:hypothetical protein
MDYVVSVNWPSTIGLILDIAGVLLLFMYGLPSKLREHGGAILSEEDPASEAERIAFNEKIQTRAKLGLRLILAGFLLQLLGTNITICFYGN